MEAATVPIGAASDAVNGARSGPYDLRPRRGAAGKTAPGAGVEALSGTAGKAGAQAQMTFRAVDVKPDESDDEYSDAVGDDRGQEDSDLDRYEIRSVASASNPSEDESTRRVDDVEEVQVVEKEESVSRHRPVPLPRLSRGIDGAGPRGHRHPSPPAFEEMTWAELDTYRRVHREFQKRALEGRAATSPRPDEPFNRGDLRSAGREARLDEGDRREPRTSRIFGTNFTASSRKPGARLATGELSDRNTMG